MLQVTSINPRFAKVDILCVNAHPLETVFHGVIRFEWRRGCSYDVATIVGIEYNCEE